jgi:hypothetical protein
MTTFIDALSLGPPDIQPSEEAGRWTWLEMQAI